MPQHTATGTAIGLCYGRWLSGSAMTSSTANQANTTGARPGTGNPTRAPRALPSVAGTDR